MFSPFIMLATTLSFLAGGATEKAICKPMETGDIFREVKLSTGQIISLYQLKNILTLLFLKGKLISSDFVVMKLLASWRF